MCLILKISSRNSLFEMLLWIHFFFFNLLIISLLFILFLFTSVILGVVKIGGPGKGSMDPVYILMDPVHGPGPRRGSMDQGSIFPILLGLINHGGDGGDVKLWWIQRKRLRTCGGLIENQRPTEAVFRIWRCLRTIYIYNI